MKTLLLTAVILCGLIGSVVAQKKSTISGDFVIGVGAATDEPIREITFNKLQYSPLLKGVDHFFATSSEPEVLLKFFRDILGLPQVWEFKNFGDFASGGVWMGNVEFEVVTWKTPPGEKLPTEFKGIGTESTGN